jgi:uncharacterized protein YjbI with pentapeptide repeats
MGGAFRSHLHFRFIVFNPTCSTAVLTDPILMLISEVLASHKEWLDSDGSRGERAELKNAVMQQADLHGANLERADLSGVRLSVADLMQANLRGANLQGADLWMSDMQDAILDGTDLRGANLTEVTGLTAAQLSQAVVDTKTQLPDILAG